MKNKQKTNHTHTMCNQQSWRKVVSLLKAFDILPDAHLGEDYQMLPAFFLTNPLVQNLEKKRKKTQQIIELSLTENFKPWI